MCVGSVGVHGAASPCKDGDDAVFIVLAELRCPWQGGREVCGLEVVSGGATGQGRWMGGRIGG